MACCITTNSDFDQGGCVMQIEWTKALCNNCQPMLQQHYSYNMDNLNILKSNPKSIWVLETEAFIELTVYKVS